MKVASKKFNVSEIQMTLFKFKSKNDYLPPRYLLYILYILPFALSIILFPLSQFTFIL